MTGLFSYDHMDYVTDADANADPSLPEMIRVAVEIMSKNPNGFVLFVEGVIQINPHPYLIIIYQLVSSKTQFIYISLSFL
jgi:hypothetical protein